MDEDAIKDLILEHIKNGQYKVEITEPNNVSRYTKYDGTTFYILDEDSARFGCHPGYCTVIIGEYSFECDLSSGEWSSNCDLEYDDDVIETIENLDDVLCGEHCDTEDYMSVYYAANPDAPDGPTYSYSGAPKDIDDLGWDDVDIEVLYTLSDNEDLRQYSKIDSLISDKKLYDLYVFLSSKGVVDDNSIIKSCELKDFDQEIYSLIEEDILDFEGAVNIDQLKFIIKLPLSVFEKHLGERDDCWSD